MTDSEEERAVKRKLPLGQDRITSVISTELNTRLKILAARTRRTVTEIIAAAVAEYVDKLEAELAEP